MEDGREVPILSMPFVGNIAEDSSVLRHERVILVVFPKKASALVIEKAEVKDSSANKDAGQSSGAGSNSDFEEVLKLIKKSEYKVVDQLMQIPSMIYVLSLLLNSKAHIESLMKVLD